MFVLHLMFRCLLYLIEELGKAHYLILLDADLKSYSN